MTAPITTAWLLPRRDLVDFNVAGREEVFIEARQDEAVIVLRKNGDARKAAVYLDLLPSKKRCVEMSAITLGDIFVNGRPVTGDDHKAWGFLAARAHKYFSSSADIGVAVFKNRVKALDAWQDVCWEYPSIVE
jgi:hypothetical protein